MKPQLFAIPIIIAVLVSSVYAIGAVSLPTKTPSIVTQTAQKDKAAVVLINSIVSGTVIIPSYTYTFAGAEGIVGTWNSAQETVTFTEDWQFSGDTEGVGTYSGTYTTEGDVLTIYYEIWNGEPTDQTVEFTFSVSGNVLTLQHPRIGTVVYAREVAATDVVKNAENMIITRETGRDAQLYTEEYSTGASGTGFIISPDGYIITNAHVVLAGENPETMLFEAVARDLEDSLYAELSKYYNIPPADREKVTKILTQKLLAYFMENGQITDVNVNYYVLNGVASPGEDIKVKSWPAVVKKQGTVYEKIGKEITWGRDVAIIKVEKANLPTVILGDSGKVEAGDRIFVIGYPGRTRDPIFKPESLLEATVTSGVVSAKRTLRTGIETIQTDTTMLPGNSGGPAYNEDGEVIGIATFGAEEGVEVNFLLPINLAKEFMNEMNIQNRHSILDTKYADALNAFWNRDCYTAIAKMKDVLALYPGHPYAQDYVTECERAIQSGEIQKPLDAGLVAVIVLVLILGIGGAVLLLYHKKAAAPPQLTAARKK